MFGDSALQLIIAAGIRANTITAVSLLLGAVGSAALALDRFELAVMPVGLSFLGDALDGYVARRSGTSSVGGALFDAAADRYQELFVMGGLAVLFRAHVVLLGLTLLAIAGSFMVSYGSAKAEAFQVPVPPGVMRRPARATWIALGVALVPVLRGAGARFPQVLGAEHAPVVVAIAAIAVAGNASAIARLRAVVTGYDSQRPCRE
jgi:phosphatidylglycerophosphate synthase